MNSFGVPATTRLGKSRWEKRNANGQEESATAQIDNLHFLSCFTAPSLRHFIILGYLGTYNSFLLRWTLTRSSGFSFAQVPTGNHGPLKGSSSCVCIASEPGQSPWPESPVGEVLRQRGHGWSGDTKQVPKLRAGRFLLPSFQDTHDGPILHETRS